ncbi:mucin-21-like isoform X1 [Senna tora]|uniref:Mucin-21-like isoform X1 n=1 Tax=Senna tora TaxID=362788 RepID=A0A834TLF1_9FABA|nr:mucin-21-like isoform X1 [Senna tora]
MAYEMPLDQIKQLQVLLRKEVNLSWYEPEKEDILTLPKLSSVAETIAVLDPSPPYLRCKICKGKLIRGLQSSICVFCGSNPHKDLPPDPIKFKDTVGYRCLLDSLHLDGSEMVGPIAEGKESNRGRNASKVEIPLSELLDLEIRRPSELDEVTSSNSGEEAFQSKGLFNLAAVDLDRFFSQRKSVSDASEEQLASNKQIDSAENNTFQANENLSFFQNAQVSETAPESTEDQSVNSFSGWEANFQSASSGAVHEETKSFDHSAVDLDEVFGSGKASIGVMKNDNLNPAASMENDWFQDDIGRTSHLEVGSQTGKPEVTMDLNFAKVEETAKSSSTGNFEWMQDDQGHGSFNKTTAVVTTDEVADSFDDWDAFAGSASSQAPSGSVSNSKITSQTGEFEMIANLNDTKTAEGTNNSSSTGNFEWFQDDHWQGSNNKKMDTVTTHDVADSVNAWDDFLGSTSTQDPFSSVPNSVITNQTGKSEISSDLNITKMAESTISSSTKNFDWVGDDQWLGSNNKKTGTVTDEVAESFDDWNDFTSSATTQDPSNNVWKQTVNQMSSAEQTSEMDIFSLSSNSHDMNFGGFKQHDLFSEQFSSPLSSAGANLQQSEFSSSRVANVDESGGNSGDASSSKLGSNVDDVEMLLSQMHDLSFMLESKLSVPQK